MLRFRRPRIVVGRSRLDPRAPPQRETAELDQLQHVAALLVTGGAGRAAPDGTRVRPPRAAAPATSPTQLGHRRSADAARQVARSTSTLMKPVEPRTGQGKKAPFGPA